MLQVERSANGEYQERAIDVPDSFVDGGRKKTPPIIREDKVKAATSGPPGLYIIALAAAVLDIFI